MVEPVARMKVPCGNRLDFERYFVHVPNFEGVAGPEDFACATLPATPLDFQGRI